MNLYLSYLIFAILIYSSSAYTLTISEKNIEYSHFSKIYITDSDSSKASSDGPYVFYKGDSIVIRSITFSNPEISVSDEIVFDKSNAVLKCNIDDRILFQFGLMKSMDIQPTYYSLPEKMLAVSDIEGNFHGFRLILEGAGVIDNNFNWTFGNGHLVLVGDFFDRGLNVTETLWLIYKLEQEAESAGGKVHFILGNHEIMNLYGNTKYVRNKYTENAELLNEPYINLFNEYTELGRWLRTKNVIEKIGNIIFTHGGISPDLANSGFTLEEINQTARENIGKRSDSISTETGKLVNSSKVGPFWYRGLVNKEVSKDEMNQILLYAEAEKIIVGHSIVDEITPLYDNTVIAIDLDHAEDLGQNHLFALLIENGDFYVIDNFGVKKKLI